MVAKAKTYLVLVDASKTQFLCKPKMKTRPNSFSPLPNLGVRLGRPGLEGVQRVQRVPLSTAPLTTAQAGAIATFPQNPTWFATNQMSASELVELLARKKGGVRSKSTSMAYLRGQVQKAYGL